jgi:hypothetical protein
MKLKQLPTVRFNASGSYKLETDRDKLAACISFMCGLRCTPDLDITERIDDFMRRLNQARYVVLLTYSLPGSDSDRSTKVTVFSSHHAVHEHHVTDSATEQLLIDEPSAVVTSARIIRQR